MAEGVQTKASGRILSREEERELSEPLPWSGRVKAARQERRERIAIAAMQGFLASDTRDTITRQEIVDRSVLIAEALMARLDRGG